ncbi:aspartate aminotransferase [Lapidilactobacillus concavus DSM 17758]|uniref:Aminotransferase n=1 Tax=Lapidilactobacillus concavus DSM 17758 TaxID=1423735 RepID=A0A0R1VQJ6_9LACO|nr:aminotransferase class I/II-fold pyridoxal phosphate-dependent enzyme [Lapidilactobacillus concavus]KRM08072.1 aspartate aminotransferase [Lapidilactobacillus concavus DSM 17758]GEL12952.1 aminotransferase [Lapidilactobacillus concavus]
MPELKKSLMDLGNRRLATVPPSAIREFDNEITTIPGLIKLTLGEPDFPVSDQVKQATKKAIDENYSHYAPSFGFIALRQEISQYLDRRYEAHYDPEHEVVVTVGATEGIYAAISALFNPGETILVPTPAFPLYETVAQVNGIQVIEVNTAPAFLLTAEKLTAVLTQHPEIKGIVLNYPNNPTGATYTHEQLEQLAAVIRQTDLVVISDEIYAELTYQESHLSLGKLLPEQTVLISGFSKSQAMTGYRIGYLAGPRQLIAMVGKMHQFLVTTAASPMMMAATEAVAHGEIATTEMRETYLQRQQLIMAALTQSGFTAPKPAGAFYIFAKIPATLTQNDVEFSYDLARSAKVGVTPGSVFGSGGEGYVRLSYAASTENLQEAGRRIQQYVSAKAKQAEGI